MLPGRLSRDGFLGPDDRPIEEIVAADLAVLESEGVSRNELADFLDDLHHAADAALETPAECCNGRVTVCLIEVMGRISCPFACGMRTHKACISVQAGNMGFTFTPMHVHLIREHGFFQGQGAPFRLDPHLLAAVFRYAVMNQSPGA